MCHLGTRFARRTRLGRLRRDVAQDLEPALADDPFGVVGVGADDAAGAVIVAGNGAVGERVVGFFRIPVALHDQELLLDVRALVALHRRGEHRPDLGPNLPPDLGRRLAECIGMLAADDRLVGIVVEKDQFRSPSDPDGLARRQHDAHGRLQTLRPACRHADGSLRPVQGPHALGHFAAPAQKRCALGRRLRWQIKRARHQVRSPGEDQGKAANA